MLLKGFFHFLNLGWKKIQNILITHEYRKNTINSVIILGAVYEGKLYMLDEKYPEVYDPISNTWNSWPKAIERYNHIIIYVKFIFQMVQILKI
jgi:hypothetical protein